jgi:mannose-6-phosphate isomerase-like protein (cupin superfamily)
MNCSRAWKFLLMLMVVAGICGPLMVRTRAQAPAAAPSGFPTTITVSSGPKTNLFPHLMTKAEVLAALAQVQDSQDLMVKTNFAITLRAASNTTKLPWKVHTEADELWFVYRGSAKVSLAPFSLMVGVTPPGKTYDANVGDIVNVPRGMAYQVVPAGRRTRRRPASGPAADDRDQGGDRQDLRNGDGERADLSGDNRKSLQRWTRRREVGTAARRPCGEP